MAQGKGPTIHSVAVVGTGVIGRSWAKVYARAGCDTRLYDKDPRQVEKALAWLEADLASDRASGYTGAEAARVCLSCVSAPSGLKAALDGVGYVQESGPEILSAKQSLYAELDPVAAPSAIIGSSTSGFDMTDIAAGIAGRRRCVVAHPVNPPHVAPAVEVVPGKDTDPDVLARTREFMISVGQRPVMMHRYVQGFIINRLQAALVREAINLVADGVADVEDVDASISDGLGLRWALMGPFGVANTNADGGVREYFTRYRDFYINLMNDLSPTPSFDPDQIERLGRGTDAMVGKVPLSAVRRWRDDLVRAIVSLKREHPFPKQN